MSSVKQHCPNCRGVLSPISGDGRKRLECPDCGWRDKVGDDPFDSDLWPDQRNDDDVDADT